MGRGATRAICALTLLLAAPVARAQVCSSSFFSWAVQRAPTTTTGPASTAANDTSFNPLGGSFNYFVQGTKLFAYSNSDGTKMWEATFSSTLQNFPSPVTLSSGAGEFIFVTTQDGRLWKIDAVNGSTSLWVDTRRSMTAGFFPSPNTFVTDPVCATDQLIATPGVQLSQFADSAFKDNLNAAGHANDDLVFVISNNQCADTTHNEIRAYYASDLSLKWVFNNNNSNAVSAPRQVDRGSEGCAIWYGDGSDPAGNTLYCGTLLQDPAGAQQSLWAINALTGALRWSYNAGSIQNRPMLRRGPDGLRVYVVNFDGGIQAFSPTVDPVHPVQGRPLWSGPLQVPLKVQAVPWPYTAGGKTHLLLVDFGGNIRDYRDDGANGFIGPAQHPSGVIATTMCPAGGLCYRGTPVAGVGLIPPKSYVGRTDGRVQQLSETLAREGLMEVNPSNSNDVDVFGVSLDVEGGATAVNRLVAVAEERPGGQANGYVTRINIPICADAPPVGAIGCACANGAVCGTGTVGDPFRCCDAAQDSCNANSHNNPCRPLRCSVEPSCCVFLFEPCLSDSDCGGRPGSCDLSLELCTSPCDPSVNDACGQATQTCQPYRGSLYQVPDNTPCDDGRLCTAAVPVPVPVDCVTAGDGTSCERDRPLSGALSGDCPAFAPICSGSNSAFSGNGGAIVGGRCCPEGTACNLATGKCRGNFGTGTNSNDVCRAGTCSSDTYASCICVSPGDRACATGLACCGGALGCVNLATNSSSCGVCGLACPGGTICVADRCCPGGVCPAQLACYPQELFCSE